MRPDAMLPHGWFLRYRDLLKEFDLVPQRLGSRSIEIPVERFTAGRINITMPEDYWLFGAFTTCWGHYGEDPNFFTMPKMATIDQRMLIDGEQAWSNYSNPLIHQGIDLQQWGPGFILNKSSAITFEYRRPIALNNALAETYVWTLLGCNILGKGQGKLKSGWRTMSRSDLEKNAIMVPSLYHGEATLEGDGTGWVEFDPINMRSRDFACCRIGTYALNPDDEMGNQIVYAPFLSQIFIDDNPIHNVSVPGISSLSWGGADGVLTSIDFSYRLPRLFRANGTIRVRMGANPYATTGTYELWNPVRILFQGYDFAQPRPQD